MQAIWLYTIIFVILFFPINVICELIICNKKGYFSFAVFTLPLLGGWIELNENGICIKLSNNKVIVSNWKNLLKKRGSLNKFKVISLYSFKSSLITGIEDYNGLIFSCFYLFIIETLSPLLSYKMPYLNLNNDVALISGRESRYVAQLKFWINNFYLFLLAIKIIIEKVEYGKRNKK